jgi:hypothetical protein
MLKLIAVILVLAGAVHAADKPAVAARAPSPYRNSNIIEEAWRSSYRLLCQRIKRPVNGKPVEDPPGNTAFVGPILDALIKIGFDPNSISAKTNDELYQIFYKTLQPLLDDETKRNAIWKALHP